jgi:predicted nucleotide-binding protein
VSPLRPRTPHAQLQHVAEQIRRGRDLLESLQRSAEHGGSNEYDLWHASNRRLFRSLLAFAEASEAYLRAAYRRTFVADVIPGLRLRCIEAELQALESLAEGLRETDLSPQLEQPHPLADGRVLVVYGRNREAKERVARFIMKLGLEAVLLDEEVARGRTLIEKLEAQSPVDFALVLLTGDDIGALGSEPERLRPRARQNVIFELGYSIAKLSRERVCALYEEGVELPSDFRGVEYQPLDGAGAWKARLAKELHAAGFCFDPLKAL